MQLLHVTASGSAMSLRHAWLLLVLAVGVTGKGGSSGSSGTGSSGGSGSSGSSSSGGYVAAGGGSGGAYAGSYSGSIPSRSRTGLISKDISEALGYFETD